MDYAQQLCGVWDQSFGPNHSQLVLKADGTYSHLLGDLTQGHSGTWSLMPAGNGMLVLSLQLREAHPMMVMGPNGPTPAMWPSVEQWAIANITPQRVDFYGGALMVRMAAPAAPQNAAQQPVQPPAFNGFPPPAGLNNNVMPPAAAQQAAPAFQPPANAPGAWPQPQAGVSGPMSGVPAPQPVTPQVAPNGLEVPPGFNPDAVALLSGGDGYHMPNIMNQWAAGMPPAQNAFAFGNPPQLPMNFGMAGMAQASPQAMVQNNQLALDNFQMQHNMQMQWLDNSQQNALDMAKERHKMAQKWADFAGS